MSRKRKSTRQRKKERSNAEKSLFGPPGTEGTMEWLTLPPGLTSEGPLTKEERTTLRRQGLVVEKVGNRYVVRQRSKLPESHR